MFTGLTSQRIQLVTELGQQTGEILRILLAVDIAVARIIGILPVNIEAIENVGCSPQSTGWVAIQLR